jgi:hypothetical protein
MVQSMVPSETPTNCIYNKSQNRKVRWPKRLKANSAPKPNRTIIRTPSKLAGINVYLEPWKSWAIKVAINPLNKLALPDHNMVFPSSPVKSQAPIQNSANQSRPPRNAPTMFAKAFMVFYN